MKMNLLNKISNRLSLEYFSYIADKKSWKTNRKIIVIESDDWGSVGMPNIEIYNKLLYLGYKVDINKYLKYDTLASIDDFTHLYEVLSNYKDKNGNHPVITANTIVANPDFYKIKANDFKNYYYEPFTETLKKYSNRSFDLWKEGMTHKLFHPQLHGREHLNVISWMNELQKGSKEFHLSFENNFFGELKESQKTIRASFNREKYRNNQDFEKIIDESISLFENIFQYNSLSFIAPNYYWDDIVEKSLYKNNVKYIQGCYAQFHPDKGRIHHYTGEISSKLNNIIYLKRNVYFEPSSFVQKDWLNTTLRQISNAFNLNQPAIICSHRVNFIGSIFEKNRIDNLYIFDQLLKNIVFRWPDVEFMTSDTLGKVIESSQV